MSDVSITRIKLDLAGPDSEIMKSEPKRPGSWGAAERRG
jgi:hypothetical protein